MDTTTRTLKLETSNRGRPNAPHHPSSAGSSHRDHDAPISKELGLLSLERGMFSSVAQSCPTLWSPWIAAHQAYLSITNSQSSPRLGSIESVMPSSHLILCRPLLLLPPIPPSIRDFSNESTLPRRWPKYWSFSFSIIPSKEIPGLISFKCK